MRCKFPHKVSNMNETAARRLRVYHFGVTLVWIGIALLAMFWVREIQKTTGANLSETYCNQGLLTLATLDIWVEDRIIYCSPGMQADLREKYR